MRKIISIILVIAITASLAIPAFAEETEAPQYGSIKVEYSDSRGSIENLEVMILDGYVYANVDSFSSRLGYKWEQNKNVVSIYSTASLWGEQTSALALHFRIGDTIVSYNPMCGIEVEYTTPAPCVQNERGIWVPFSYTLYLLGGSRNIAGDVVTVQMPAQNVLSIAAMITNNESVLSFDWVDDFGYSETATNVTDGAARVVTLFEGLLSFDGSAWTSFVDWNAFDKKFGKTLAALLCTYSSDELKDSIEEVEVMLDVFDPDGALGSLLRTQETLIDSDVNAWEKICKEKLAQLKAGCGTLPQYNMAYRQYERATKKQDLFSAVGADEIIYIQDGLAEATNALEWAKRIGYGVTYLAEFQKRDDFQTSVLKNYFATRKDTDKLDDAAAKAIADYASSDIIEYTLSKFFENHALEILVDESGLDALMGVPANLLLLAWDIMSETIPFYSEGLDSVENREISNYAQQVQNDAYQNLNTLIASLRADTSSLSPEDCVQLAEYCYVYLKSCYIARSFAIDSLENVSEETREILESKVSAETEVNLKIAKYLSILSRADSANSCYILGFLPKNNEELVTIYTDESIVDIVILGDNVSTVKILTEVKGYDESGNLTSKQVLSYDDSDRLTGIVANDYGENEAEYRTEITYDTAGRMVSCITSNSAMPFMTSGTEYTYDSNGVLIREFSWEGGASETLYEYDSLGRRTRMTVNSDVGSDVTEYSYNGNDLVKSAKKTIINTLDGNSWTETTTYSYNAQRQLVNETTVSGDSSSTTTYSYDTLGRLVEVSSVGGYSETSTNIDYAYKPFVVENKMLGGGYHSTSAYIKDDAGHKLYSFTFYNPQFYSDADGYLIKIVDTHESRNGKQTYTYEFCYEAEQTQLIEVQEQTQSGLSWNQLYYDFVVQDKRSSNLASSDWKWVEYELIYVDEDDIPELWINYQMQASGCRLVTISKEKVCETLLGEGMLSYIEYGNTFHHTFGVQGVYGDKIYKLENGSPVILAEGSYNIYEMKYSWDGQVVSEQAYTQKINNYIDFSVALETSTDRSTRYTYEEILAYLNSL